MNVIVKEHIKGRKPRIVKLMADYTNKHGNRLLPTDIQTVIDNLIVLKAKREQEIAAASVETQNGVASVLAAPETTVEAVSEVVGEAEPVNSPNAAVTIG